ncbi:ACT domain-containing protein [Nodosilinea sp. LEGE 07088]|uniref:ACT domain-containing protein n=1 Tax=Nodosilinea sp. LEGE 07088 TaxID=2777968 RepID=UPI00187F9895|nr:ACT domain-containing protein [Nodosilinea sp. LEGE 07088]MBE9141256.1 ACT domain-containing protein [Nodosilinea sp. LEGE 07088]
MTGETDLSKLLTSMQPLLQPGEYVFCSIPAQTSYSPSLDPMGCFKEEEGLTLILSRQQADEVGLPYDAVFAMITLAVHSSLEAVGFLAAIATHLASHGISVNPVSAFYHDHLFVPAAQAERAIALLEALSQANHDAP